MTHTQTIKKPRTEKVNQQIQRGRVKKTLNQKKKHASQMSMEELLFLKERIKVVAYNYRFSAHFEDSRRLFDELSIERLLNAPNAESCIIEYNETDESRRVLLRSDFSVPVKLGIRKKTVKTDANLCLVVDLYTAEIITAYWNQATDNHANIDMNRYTEDLVILK